MKAPLLPLEEAQARLLALAERLPVERVDISSLSGRFLAEPLLAQRTQPACDLSAMDGYAVAGGDLDGPWQVIGESAAGHPFPGTVTHGTAVRIATGAVMPAGGEVVILQEDIAREGNLLSLAGTPPNPPGKHIRRTGLDFRTGDELLGAGTRFGPAQIALAISGGHRHIAVRRRPVLAVLDSGDELSGDDGNCAPHQIPASNGAMLAALAAPLAGQILHLGPVPDRMDAIAAALTQAERADVIVTSGGASVGDHDLIRPALEAWGADLDFWRVAIKPGKPILVARRGRQLIVGLPGNPVSSHVTAFLFLLPLLRALQGSSQPLPRRFATRLASPIRAGGSRREFLRAIWDGRNINALSLQDSGALSSLAAANALIDRPAGAVPAGPGDEVLAYLLENGGTA